MSEAQQDNRNFSRIIFDAHTHISRNDKEWQTELLDISLKGALVEKPADWDEGIGSEHLLRISLSGDIHIDMQASVAHVEANQIGFDCHHIDLDSITHLRRIVELNTGNEELLNRELSALKKEP
jgi:hypothetical protein